MRGKLYIKCGVQERFEVKDKVNGVELNIFFPSAPEACPFLRRYPPAGKRFNVFLKTISFTRKSFIFFILVITAAWNSAVSAID